MDIIIYYYFINEFFLSNNLHTKFSKACSFLMLEELVLDQTG